jgi:hypothetical protein
LNSEPIFSTNWRSRASFTTGRKKIGEMIAFAKRIHTETRPARRALFDNAGRADAALLEHLADNLEEVWLDAQLEHSTLAANDNWSDEISWPLPFTQEDIANAAIIIRQRARD